MRRHDHDLSTSYLAFEEADYDRPVVAVELRGWLVRDDYVGISSKGPRQSNALLLSARQLVRKSRTEIAETDRCKCRFSTVGDDLPWQPAGLQRQRDVLGRRQVRN